MKNIFIAQHEVEKIHNASLDVLEKTGIFLDHEEAERILLCAGAKKDKGRIFIPRKLVEDALKKPKK